MEKFWEAYEEKLISVIWENQNDTEKIKKIMAAESARLIKTAKSGLTRKIGLLEENNKMMRTRISQMQAEVDAEYLATA